MNREQYLAKRMWFHSMAANAGRRAAIRHQMDDDLSASPISPPASLADYYQRFHRHGEQAAAADQRSIMTGWKNT